MTDTWFKLKEISKDIKTLQSYSDLWEFVRKVSTSNRDDAFGLVSMAKDLINKYSELERENNE